jgi:2-keto-4-pentenoate hydratase
VLAGSVDVREVADLLDRAHESRSVLDAQAVPVPDLDTAYAIQDALTERRLGRGGTRAGWKLGYTSAAMREQMGIDEPNVGPLLDTMLVESGALVALTQPRVEPEIALELATDLVGPCTADQALAACARARAVLEVVDSVWEDYRFDLEHNTADGSSAAAVVLGPEIPTTDLDRVEVRLHHEGRLVGTGSGTDVLGHPAAALAWLAGFLAARGERLHAGDLVITGGLTAAVPLGPGDVVHAEFDLPGGGTRRVSVRG